MIRQIWIKFGRVFIYMEDRYRRMPKPKAAATATRFPLSSRLYQKGSVINESSLRALALPAALSTTTDNSDHG